MYLWKTFLKAFKKYGVEGFQKSSKNNSFYYTKINIFLYHENTVNREYM